MAALSPAVIVILVILGILALVGIVFANGVSVLWATFIFLGIFLFIISGLSIFSVDARENIEKVDLLGRLRGFLVSRFSFSIQVIIQRILILIMSAASVAIIVRAIVFVVNAVTEYAKTESWDNMDWLIDLMGDAPVLNIVVLMKQGFETEFRPDFFVIVLLLSLVVMGFAAAVVQVIMALVNNAIYEAKADSILFRILGNFSVTTLMISGTMFISGLISPLIDFSKTWDGFEDFCRPFLSSSFGNFLLQVLVTVAMFAFLVTMCFDWVQTIVMGASGLIVWLIFLFFYSIICGLFKVDISSNVTDIYMFLLCILYPIVDIIKNLICEDNRELIWLPVAVPVGLSIITVLVATVIGKINPLAHLISNTTLLISVLVFVVYLLAMPGIDIARSSDEE